MLGWMDAEALRRTLTEGRVTFWSRSRQEYWRKGDTSRQRAVRARRGASTATATRCSSRSSRSAPPATRARAPASTSTRSRSPWHPRPPTDHAERRRGDPSAVRHHELRGVHRARRRAPRRARHCASSSPTARRPSASTASSRAAARARSCSNPPNRAASGRATPSSASSSLRRAHRARRPASTWHRLRAPCRARARRRGRPRAARRPRGISTSAGAPRRSPGTRPSPAGSSASSAGRRSARSSTCPNRPPADFRDAGTGLQPSSPSSSCIDHRTGTVHARSRRPCTTATTRPRPSGSTRRSGSTRCSDDSPARRRRGSPRSTSPSAAAPTHRTEQADFLAAVERSKEYIRDGDVFQVVISQRFDHEVTAEPIDVYRVLRSLNPSPYMYLLHARRPGGRALLDRRLVARGARQGAGRARLHPPDRRVEAPRRDARAGRRPRGRAARRPQGAGRAPDARRPRPQRPRKVCIAGSVEVTEFMRVERFSHIMHLVSSVEGDLRPAGERGRRVPGDVPGRHPLGCAEAARARDHRRARARPARRVRRRRRATSASPATPTSRSRSARRRSSGGIARVQAGGGLVADSDARDRVPGVAEQGRRAAARRRRRQRDAEASSDGRPHEAAGRRRRDRRRRRSPCSRGRQTWFELDCGCLRAGRGEAIAVPGSVASPALAALGLAALALVAALAIAGPVFRSCSASSRSCSASASSLAVGVSLGDPVAAVAPAVTDATGITGAGPTAELVAAATATAWPAVGHRRRRAARARRDRGAGHRHRWPASSRRYRGARLADADAAEGAARRRERAHPIAPSRRLGRAQRGRRPDRRARPLDSIEQTSPPRDPKEHHERRPARDPGHGHSPAAWTAVIIMLVAFTIGTVAFCLDIAWLVWASAGAPRRRRDRRLGAGQGRLRRQRAEVRCRKAH